MSIAAFEGLWYLDLSFAQRMKEIVLPRLEAGKEPVPAMFRQILTQPQVSAISTDFYDENGFFDQIKYDLFKFKKSGGGNVAVIPVTGTMSRYGYCGYGNEYIGKILDAAAVDKEVTGVILKMDSPGGTVDSTETFADQVSSFPKRIESVITAISASANYFVASQSDAIHISPESTAKVGSIGTLMVYSNVQRQLQTQGVDVKIIRSNASVDKARVNPVEPLTAELEAGILSELDAAQKVFAGYVKRGRAGKLTSDEVFTGKMYGAKEAMKLGLVDDVNTLGSVIKSFK